MLATEVCCINCLISHGVCIYRLCRTVFFFTTVPTTTTEASTTPRVTRTTSEGEIVTTTTTGQPSTTTPGEVCERVLGMDDPQLVPGRFIEVSIHSIVCNNLTRLILETAMIMFMVIKIGSKSEIHQHTHLLIDRVITCKYKWQSPLATHCYSH